MEIQWGKYPEFTFSICSNFHWWGGEFALPFKLGWWNSVDCVGNRQNDISVTILCFRIGLEIWRFVKK